MDLADSIDRSSYQRARVGSPRDGAQLAATRHVPISPAREKTLERRAVALGWFSIGLGLAELVAPRQVARLIGADEDDATTHAVLMGTGVRELVCGLGLLSKSRPATWAWARVAGDVMDIALLGYVWNANRIVKHSFDNISRVVR